MLLPAQRGGLPPAFGQGVALGAQHKCWSWQRHPDLAEAVRVLGHLPISCMCSFWPKGARIFPSLSVSEVTPVFCTFLDLFVH